jgi:hypothetical protein
LLYTPLNILDRIRRIIITLPRHLQGSYSHTSIQVHNMRSLPVFLTLFCSLLVTTLFAQPQPILRPSSVPTLALPALDNALLLDEERALREPGRAPYFAQTRKVNVRPTTEGTWTDNADGTTTWRLRVSSPNALSINLGFTEYWMPAGGELYLHTPTMKPITNYGRPSFPAMNSSSK